MTSVIDRTKSKPFFDAHVMGGDVHGLRPILFASGDQVTVPSEIVERLKALDPNAINETELRAIIELADGCQ